ncbi:MAG: carboxymuconolactone decarboxylase family protein [Rhodothermales bacterium]
MAQPPKRFLDFLEQHEAVGEAYQALGEATTKAGPLDEKAVRLIKLGISIGMRHEGAVHAHARKALAAGCTPEELRHTALLATTTLGFPSMMAAYSWVEDILASGSA